MIRYSVFLVVFLPVSGVYRRVPLGLVDVEAGELPHEEGFRRFGVDPSLLTCELWERTSESDMAGLVVAENNSGHDYWLAKYPGRAKVHKRTGVLSKPSPDNARMTGRCRGSR